MLQLPNALPMNGLRRKNAELGVAVGSLIFLKIDTELAIERPHKSFLWPKWPKMGLEMREKRRKMGVEWLNVLLLHSQK
jgi:hypothetical protein